MQALDTIYIIESISLPDLCEDDVLSALMEGLMCPALVELVCEALGSTGGVPERLIIRV